MIFTDLELSQGARVPFGYGVAWQRQTSLTYVVLPMPLHFIAGFIRRAWHEFKMGYHGAESALDRAHVEGYKVGVKVANEQEFSSGQDYGETRALRIVKTILDARGVKL